MDFIYVIMLVFMTGSFCIMSFSIGILIGKCRTDFDLNPVKNLKKQIKIKKEQEEYDLAQKQNAIMMENINNYSGSSIGQVDIPE